MLHRCCLKTQNAWSMHFTRFLLEYICIAYAYTYIYIYIYMYVCCSVCVCVILDTGRGREREREEKKRVHIKNSFYQLTWHGHSKQEFTMHIMIITICVHVEGEVRPCHVFWFWTAIHVMWWWLLFLGFVSRFIWLSLCFGKLKQDRKPPSPVVVSDIAWSCLVDWYKVITHRYK